jgi:hypothetical protein
LVTPTPPVSPLATPEAFDIGRPLLVRSSTVITQALVNGRMEEPYRLKSGTTTISEPFGWSINWFNKPPCTPEDHLKNGCLPVIPCPLNCIRPSGNCSGDYNCYFAMPEATRILAIEHEGLRVFEGAAAAKIFANRMWRGWYYQSAQVGAGNQVTASVKAQTWQCFDFANCSKGKRSDRPTAMHLRIGIDPFGGTVMTSTNVVWSAEIDASQIDKNDPNIWHEMSVTTFSRAFSVTVFIDANVDWSLPSLNHPEVYDGNYARGNNDLYLDDARLEVRVLNPIRKVYLPAVRR